jgi:hypothetical protein
MDFSGGIALPKEEVEDDILVQLLNKNRVELQIGKLGYRLLRGDFPGANLVRIFIRTDGEPAESDPISHLLGSDGDAINIVQDSQAKPPNPQVCVRLKPLIDVIANLAPPFKKVLMDMVAGRLGNYKVRCHRASEKF